MTIDILTIQPPTWMDNGICAGRPTEDNPIGRRNYGRAVDVRWMPDGAAAETASTRSCRGCPVINDCLNYALQHPELEGVWGGTTTAQRADLRRQGVA